MDGILFYYTELNEKMPVATVENAYEFLWKVSDGKIEFAEEDKKRTLYLWTLGTAFLIRQADYQ